MRRNEAHRTENGGEPGLKGTFAAVLLLGAFIAVSWTVVFLLFMNR